MSFVSKAIVNQFLWLLKMKCRFANCVSLLVVLFFLSDCDFEGSNLDKMLEKFSNANLPLIIDEKFTYEYGEWERSSDLIIRRSYNTLDSLDLNLLGAEKLLSNCKFYSRQVALKKFVVGGNYNLLLYTNDWVARDQEQYAHDNDWQIVLAVLDSNMVLTDKIIIGRDRPEQLLITSELDQNLILKIRTDSIPLIGEIKTSHHIYHFNKGKFITKPALPVDQR